MVLRTRFSIILLVLVFAVVPARAQRPGEVNLPLKDYLELVETVEKVEHEQAEKIARREAPLAEVLSQRVALVLASGSAETASVTSEFEVLIQGDPKGSVLLPLAGVPVAASVTVAGPNGAGPVTAAAITAGPPERAGSVQLVAPASGRYTVRVQGPAPLEGGGIRQLALAAVAAPVASTEIDLPADLDWKVPGSVVVDDQAADGRRKVRLTTRRGERATLEVRRKGENGDADKLLAQSSVLTLIQLGPDGPRRHDVVLYEVSRGRMGSFTVDLPPGLSVEKAGTDEGDVVPVVEARRLTVQRRAQLPGTGYLVLTSTPDAGATLPLDAVTLDEAPVRARYLAFSTSVAAETRPLPESAWRRVDLDDLPAMFRDALAALDLSAAWRLTGVPQGLSMAVSTLQAAPVLPVVVRLRETTTLLTVDGTLLHRDRLVLKPTAGLTSTVELALPPSAILWSAQVDDLPVRPLNRDGTLSIPLGFETGKESVVEVVSVLEKAIPKGRSELALTLARIGSPVQEHRWRLLLPDGNRYRFRSGDLRPAALPVPRQASRPLSTGATISAEELERIPTSRDPWVVIQNTPGVLTDRINVGGNESGQQSMYIGPGGNARIQGKVLDDQGAALPGVTVQLIPPSGEPVFGVTDARGFFLFVSIPGGTYRLQAELEGFSTVDYPNVQVSSGSTASLEVHLSAAVEDVITVTSESPLLDERRTGNTQTYTMDSGRTTGFIPGRKKKAPPAPPPAYYEFGAFEEMAKTLQQGLVGGVKPLNVVIPESGKVLLMAGALPPAEVKVELEVKAQKR